MDCLILVRAFPSSSAACTRRSTAWPVRKKERRKKETRLSVSRVFFLLMGVQRGVVVVVALPSPGCFEFGRESVRSPRRNFRKVTNFSKRDATKGRAPEEILQPKFSKRDARPPKKKKPEIRNWQGGPVSSTKPPPTAGIRTAVLCRQPGPNAQRRPSERGARQSNRRRTVLKF